MGHKRLGRVICSLALAGIIGACTNEPSTELVTNGIYGIREANGAPLPLFNATVLNSGANTCVVDVLSGSASFTDGGTYTFRLTTMMHCETGNAQGSLRATGTFQQEGHTLLLTPGLSTEIQVGGVSISDGVLRADALLPSNPEPVHFVLTLTD